MKRLFAIMAILFGVILMNSPPVIASSYSDDCQIECADLMEFQSIDAFEIQIISFTVYLETATWPGGLELKYPATAWSATIYTSNNYNAIRTDLLVRISLLEEISINSWQIRNQTGNNLEKAMGLFRLDVGEIM